MLARVNQLKDKTPLFKAASAPKDKTGAPLKLNEWGLKNYLDVAHELAWISKTTKDVGEVVRDYRNYIHPVEGILAWRQHLRRRCANVLGDRQERCPPGVETLKLTNRIRQVSAVLCRYSFPASLPTQ